ncbi:hypothetical protein Tco_0185255 [Tanacetum coccineum]
MERRALTGVDMEQTQPYNESSWIGGIIIRNKKDVTIDTNLLREEAKVGHDSSFKSLEDIAKDSGPKIEYDISLVTTNSSKKDLNYCFKTFYLYLMVQSQWKPTLAPKNISLHHVFITCPSDHRDDLLFLNAPITTFITACLVDRRLWKEARVRGRDKEMQKITDMRVKLKLRTRGGHGSVGCSEDRLSTIVTKLDTPFMLDSYTSVMCTESWGRLSYARAMIELRADVELKDNIVVVVPKLIGERFSMCTICIEYECKLLKCSSCKVFGHVLDDCHKKSISDVLKNLTNPRQAVRRIQVDPKLGFKPIRQVYQHVSKKNGVSASGKKKQAELTRQEVSNSNSFDALNMVENDDDLDMNGGKLKLAQKGVNLHVVSSAHGTSSKAFGSPTNTHLTERINNLERHIFSLVA